MIKSFIVRFSLLFRLPTDAVGRLFRRCFSSIRHSPVMAIIARLLLINYAMGKLLKLDGNCLRFKWHYGFQALQNICSLLFKCQRTNDRAGIFNICVDLTMGPTTACCISNDILLILCRLLYSMY